MDTDTPAPPTPSEQPSQAPVPPTSGGTEVAPTVAPTPLAEPATTPPVTPPPAPEKPARGVSKGVLSGVSFFLSWIVFPIAAVFILHFFVFQAYHVVGTSMSPTLHTTDYLIISKVDYTKALLERDLLHRNDLYIPHREQIIVFHYPKDPSLIFVKRVIGLPGDHVVVAGGKVTVYNEANPKGFDPNTGYEPTDTQTLGSVDMVIPAGQIFVLGDNRTPGGSFDSRDWGTVPSSYIIGNAVLRLLPLDQARTF